MSSYRFSRYIKRNLSPGNDDRNDETEQKQDYSER